MDEIYCVCADCTKCGCGMWEKHHKSVAEVETSARVDRDHSPYGTWECMVNERADW